VWSQAPNAFGQRAANRQPVGACDHTHPDHVALDGDQSAACLLFDEDHSAPVSPGTGLPGPADTDSAARTDGGEE
jgi:hypothetical protein